jgi:hypothetical protein
MLVRSNSDTDFFKDKKFIENINTKIQKVDDLSKSKKRTKKIYISLKENDSTKLKHALSGFESVSFESKQHSFSKSYLKNSIDDDSMNKDKKHQIKTFLEKFWQIHKEADIYFKYKILNDLKMNVK